MGWRGVVPEVFFSRKLCLEEKFFSAFGRTDFSIIANSTLGVETQIRGFLLCVFFARKNGAQILLDTID
jgi:hypothetical protein